MWEYIRNRVRDAVLLGINDAMQQLHSVKSVETPVELRLEYQEDSEPNSKRVDRRQRMN